VHARTDWAGRSSGVAVLRVWEVHGRSGSCLPPRCSDPEAGRRARLPRACGRWPMWNRKAAESIGNYGRSLFPRRHVMTASHVIGSGERRRRRRCGAKGRASESVCMDCICTSAERERERETEREREREGEERERFRKEREKRERYPEGVTKQEAAVQELFLTLHLLAPPAGVWCEE